MKKRENDSNTGKSPLRGDLGGCVNSRGLLFICYPRCTTCQKARKWLDEKGISYTFRDIKTDNPTLEELSEWYKKSGFPIKKFFNTSGLLYKEQNMKDKVNTLSDDELLKILSSDGMMVKRPLVIADNFVLVGFKESEWEKMLK
ncbi:arsenate reductase family protein [Bacteroidales bacterium OttesenSCG-928-I21]|nr:arsenate reductase family protein [Bacteroidales bacterium OttesenSCG-928-I21]